MKKIEAGGWSYELYEGRVPVGIVLVHQIMGLTEYERSVAEALSKEGYWVVLVDLFRGKHPKDFKEGQFVRDSLKEEEILECIGGGQHILRERYGSGSLTGTMGFCMGGGYALLGACHLDFEFCVDYYGMIMDADAVESLRGPTILMLGSEDQRVTPWAFSQLLPAMQRRKKRIDAHLYPNAGHAFHMPGAAGYSEAAAKDAWDKTLHFLKWVQGNR